MPDNNDSNARFERIEATLEALARRQQGLTETVELLAAMHRDLEQRTAERFATLADAMTHLIQIVESHERRLDDLES